MAKKPRDPNQLTPIQERAIVALMAQPTIAEAASVAGVSDRALYIWLNESTFIEAYRSARQQAMANATANLQRATGEAVKVLTEVMNDKDEKGSTRIAAARAVLEAALKASELEDLAIRIEALERSVMGKV